MATKKITVVKDRETPNKVVFKEEVTDGAPVLETVYLPKWWVKGAKVVEVTLEYEEE